jgi:hypothetical protein
MTRIRRSQLVSISLQQPDNERPTPESEVLGEILNRPLVGRQSEADCLTALQCGCSLVYSISDGAPVRTALRSESALRRPLRRHTTSHAVRRESVSRIRSAACKLDA